MPAGPAPLRSHRAHGSPRCGLATLTAVRGCQMVHHCAGRSREPSRRCPCRHGQLVGVGFSPAAPTRFPVLSAWALDIDTPGGRAGQRKATSQYSFSFDKTARVSTRSGLRRPDLGVDGDFPPSRCADDSIWRWFSGSLPGEARPPSTSADHHQTAAATAAGWVGFARPAQLTHDPARRCFSGFAFGGSVARWASTLWRPPGAGSAQEHRGRADVLPIPMVFISNCCRLK